MQEGRSITVDRELQAVVTAREGAVGAGFLHSPSSLAA